MANKTYTILIASNQHGETRRVTISASWLKALGFLGFCFVLLACTGAVDYMGLLMRANENHLLRAENSNLHKQFQVVEEKLSSLEAGLDRIQNFTKKLNLITNVDDDERILKLALSPSTRNSSPAVDTASVTRLPSSEFLVREPQIGERFLLDEKSGELGTSADNTKDFASLSIRIDRAVKMSQLREQGIIQLWDSLSERQSLLAATPSMKPARGWFTSRFGYRVDPITSRSEMHAGLDIAAPPGTPVYAPADGVVSYVSYEAGYGKLVSIDHGYGVITRYGHNSRVFVEQGQKVKRWDVISLVGNTGRSTGAHLHYEVRVHGVPVDPFNYILNE